MFRDDDTLSQTRTSTVPRPATIPPCRPYHRVQAHNQRGGLGDPHQVQPEVAVGELVADPLGYCSVVSDVSRVTPGVSVSCSRPSWVRAVATMFSTVNPNLACSTFSGADAPKVRIPMIAPVGPTQRSQPNVEPFSTDTLAVIDGGSTSSR